MALQLTSRCELTNSEVLIFVLGWQGGTLKMVCDVLGVRASQVLGAKHGDMVALCSNAQLVRRLSGTER